MITNNKQSDELCHIKLYASLKPFCHLYGKQTCIRAVVPETRLCKFTAHPEVNLADFKLFQQDMQSESRGMSVCDKGHSQPEL